jgi:hypothetical protein
MLHSAGLPPFFLLSLPLSAVLTPVARFRLHDRSQAAVPPPIDLVGTLSCADMDMVFQICPTNIHVHARRGGG